MFDYYLTQELSLDGEATNATIGWYGDCMSPEELRKLANELESFILKSKNKGRRGFFKCFM